MTGEQDDDRRARVALSFLANPGDPVLGAALRTRSASEVLAAITGSDVDGQALLADQPQNAALARAIARWRARIADHRVSLMVLQAGAPPDTASTSPSSWPRRLPNGAPR